MHLVALEDANAEPHTDDELAEEESWIDERSGGLDTKEPPRPPRRSA